MGVVAGVPDLDLLGDAAALLGGEVASGLGLELEFVTLEERECQRDVMSCYCDLLETYGVLLAYLCDSELEV